MRLIFADVAWEDYLHWQSTDTKTVTRINALIRECWRDPFRGTGKPEPLRGNYAGFWSRRISREDRLIYRMTGAGDDQALEIVQCRYHY